MISQGNPNWTPCNSDSDSDSDSDSRGPASLLPPQGWWAVTGAVRRRPCAPGEGPTVGAASEARRLVRSPVSKIYQRKLCACRVRANVILRFERLVWTRYLRCGKVMRECAARGGSCAPPQHTTGWRVWSWRKQGHTP
eukprot:366286-Chlamydomonas_euryale.AAC.16